MEICFLLSHNYKKFVYFQKNIVDMKTKYIKDYLVEIVKKSVLEPNDTLKDDILKGEVFNCKRNV